MKTIVLEISNNVDFLKEQKVYNSIVRYAFNRFQENYAEKEVRHKCQVIFQNEKSWFLQCAVKDAQMIFNKVKYDKIVFGSKNNLFKFLKGLKSKEEYKLDKLRPICIQGEKLQKGNRSFEFHFNENYVTYKLSKDWHEKIEICKLRKNYLRELLKIQELANSRQIAVTVKLDSAKQKLSIAYDESLLSECHYKDLKENRVIGIDLNPNYIGLSILEFDKTNSEKFDVLHKQVFDLSSLTKKEVSKNKRHHELIQICHDIDKLVNTWKCSRICIEDLNMSSSNRGKGKNFNRLCNNVWNRGLVVNKLKMLANAHRYFITEINPAYSSFIGNMLYGDANTPDMIAASIEIARRAYNKFNKGHFYPKFNIEALDEQWKQILSEVEDWKEAFVLLVKELGLKYRFQLFDCIQNAVFSKFYRKKLVTFYSF